MKLNEEDEIKLFKEEKIEKHTTITFQDQENLTLWPEDKSGIRVNRGQYGGSLSVKYSHLKKQSGNGGTGSSHRITLNNDQYEEDTYVCNWGELSRGRETLVYEGGHLKGRDSVIFVQPDKKMKIQLTVIECLIPSKVTKQATCNLKVTDGNDLKILN